MILEYIILIILIGYFYKLSVKDYIKESKNQKFIKENLKVGSKIISKSGIIGEVLEMDETSLIIITGTLENNSYIRLDKQMVKAIIE
ncbi:MAG: preprotein translocase subunit YajC [Anaerococcus sp.]|nr:preprotein translocase subunit YajC [Anaerococcus sp.]